MHRENEGYCRQVISTTDKQIVIRLAADNEASKIHALMVHVASLLDRTALFVLDDLCFVEDHISRRGFVVVAENMENKQLVGCFIFRFPGKDQDNLGIDLEFTEEQLARVVHLESAVVDPDYRGLALQKGMLQFGERLLRRRGEAYLLATVSPDNPASFHTLEKCGYKRRLTKKKYEGLMRHIYEKAVTNGLFVDGTVLRDGNGNPFVLRGINHSHCWYKQFDETAFDAIAATGANCIRIVLAGGIQWESDTDQSLREMIEAAAKRKMVAIVEIHDGTGSDDPDVLRKIGDTWCEWASVLGGTEGYCIVNIANEWFGSHSSEVWAKSYEEVIPRLRRAGIQNTIMVDAAGWGQYGWCIKHKGKEVFESDPLGNTMFSIHMYGTAGGSEWKIKGGLMGATSQNLCVCVGEFGYTHTDGDVKEKYIMEYCKEQGIGYLAWSWKGNSGGVEYLDLANEWDGSVLSPEWGANVIDGPNGIRETSVLCSVFTD